MHETAAAAVVVGGRDEFALDDVERRRRIQLLLTPQAIRLDGQLTERLEGGELFETRAANPPWKTVVDGNL